MVDRLHPEDRWAVTALSQYGGPVTCAKGLTVHAHASYTDAPHLDVLMQPGG